MKGIMLLLALVIAPPSLAADDDAIAVAVSEAIEAAGESRLIVLGEMHGTREMPVLVGKLVEHYLAEGPVVLALEMERTEHQALSRYLASDGAAGARDALRQRPYWSIAEASNDGRRSIDMLGLIEHMRVLRGAGRDVGIAPYDLPPQTYSGSSERELGMARYLRSAFEALPRGRMLVLSGNVHALLQPRVFPSLGRTIEPMTYHLRDLKPYSINVSATAGASWGCSAAQCGAQSYSHGGSSGPLGAAPERYHYQVVLPSLTIARLPGGNLEASR